MIGERCQVQRQTKTPPSTSAAANEPTTRALVQPHSSPLTIPSTSAAIASPKSAAPSRSGMRRRPGARLSTRCRRASTTATTPMGRFTRKTSRQSAAATSRPPSDGPRPAAAAETADRRATPWERRSGGKASSTSASEDGTSIAAPSAWTTRNAIRVPGDGASAHSTEATVNTSRPTTNTRRRPMTSAMRPAAIRNAAKTML